MIEVEVKAHVSSLDEIAIKLDNMGAKKLKKEHQADTYFNAPHRDFAVTDEALRIRKTISEGYEQIFITYKGAKIDKTSKTRKEIEVGVEDPDKVAGIFKNLGFQKVATVKKDRISYKLADFTITLDEVHNVGSFVEIEIEAEEGEDFHEALDEIFAIYAEIGIKDGFERSSYLELMGIH